MLNFQQYVHTVAFLALEIFSCLFHRRTERHNKKNYSIENLMKTFCIQSETKHTRIFLRANRRTVHSAKLHEKHFFFLFSSI